MDNKVELISLFWGNGRADYAKNMIPKIMQKKKKSLFTLPI
jgi:hypothetical protein